jgi:hypothetical protein
MDLLFARQAEMELVSRAKAIRYRIVRIERMLTYWLAQPDDARTSALVMGERRHQSLAAIREELRAKLTEARAELAGEGRGRGVPVDDFDCGGLGCGSQPCSCERRCPCSYRDNGFAACPYAGADGVCVNTKLPHGWKS